MKVLNEGRRPDDWSSAKAPWRRPCDKGSNTREGRVRWRLGFLKNEWERREPLALMLLELYIRNGNLQAPPLVGWVLHATQKGH
jgi:hypothetical protein